MARRNLVFSIFSEHIGFSVWSLWSVFVLFLGPRYGISQILRLAAAEKFLLTSLPPRSARAALAVHVRGGKVRRPQLDVVSAALLLVPTVAAAFVLTPGVSLQHAARGAALAGFGGGNFASSMANINAFYPQRLKGWALGLNAGGGNIGVAVVQLVGLAVLATAGKPSAVLLGDLHPAHRHRRAVRVRCSWTTSPMCATRSARCETPAGTRTPGSSRCSTSARSARSSASASPSARCCRTSSARLPRHGGKVDPVKVAYLTFLGPLLGSLAGPRRRLADRFGGARTTFWNFAAMAIAAAAVLIASLQHRSPLFFAGSSRCSSCPAWATARRTR